MDARRPLRRKVCVVGKYTIGVYVPRRLVGRRLYVIINKGNNAFAFPATPRAIGSGAYVAIPAYFKDRFAVGERVAVEIYHNGGD